MTIVRCEREQIEVNLPCVEMREHGDDEKAFCPSFGAGVAWLWGRRRSRRGRPRSGRHGGAGGSAGSASDYHVSATVDGVPYEGNSKGAVFTEAAGDTPSQLMFFPADPISGNLYGWTLGETGTWDLSSDGSTPAMLMYIDGTTQYVSSSGTLKIKSWLANVAENPADPRLGFIGGSFEGSFASTGGTVEVSGGSFYSMVTRTTSR